MFKVLLAALFVGVSVYAFAQRKTGRHRTALDPTKYKKFKLSSKTKVTQDTYIFRFKLDTPDQRLGLPIGQHITLRALCDVKREADDKSTITKQEMVQHSYTPISSDDDLGYVDLLVKVYFANVHPKFPFGGRLSQYLYQMKVGQEMEMMGPKGQFEYLGCGEYKIASRKARTDAFAMVAGGTGITPLLQVLRAIKNNPDDKTKVYLVYGNQTEADILLRNEIDEVARRMPKQVRVWYTIDREPSKNWKYDVGFVTEDLLRKHLPTANEGFTVNGQDDEISSVLALMCGPPPMLQYAVKPNLAKMGYSPEMMFSF